MNYCSHCIHSVRRDSSTFWCGVNSDRQPRTLTTPACEDYEDERDFMEHEEEDNDDYDPYWICENGWEH